MVALTASAWSRLEKGGNHSLRDRSGVSIVVDPFAVAARWTVVWTSPVGEEAVMGDLLHPGWMILEQFVFGWGETV
jgi:hypothetical protein